MTWTPSSAAIHIEVVCDDDNPVSVLLEHFNDPYEVEVPDGTDASLRQAAHAYLSELDAHADIQPQLRLPAHWLDALDPATAGPAFFGWLPFAEPRPAAHQDIHGPYGSFRFAPAWDEVVVLFASDRTDATHYLGSGFGLALVTRIRDDGGTLKASFVGLCASLPYGVWAQPLSDERMNAFRSLFTIDSLFTDSDMRAKMATASTLDAMTIRGVRIAASDDQWWIERRATGVRSLDGVTVPYAVTMCSSGGNGMATTDTITHVAPLVADAVGDARVFDYDPSSTTGRVVRPTHDNLNQFRVVENIFPGIVNQGPLEFPAGVPAPLVRVMPCPRFVPADRAAAPGNTRQVNLAPGAGQPPVLSDDAAAIQAFFHARELVLRMQAYGWTPANYFRITAADIKIHYRSGVSPGPGKDGRTVNARVIPDGWPANAMAWNGPARPAVNIHLASADLRVRERAASVAGGLATPATTLGIAADKRWMWHEFGHVLLVASTGELELRFAHSAGDAMAAIVSDPESKLQGSARGLTFPFVFLPRQHDRCAAHGWSWSGSIHQGLANVPAALQPRAKGYGSEQILSSSLFRLYRCIGGDTIQVAAPQLADVYARRRASHYTLYLIMLGIYLMGDARIQPNHTPAQFVTRLRQADRQNGSWNVAWPPNIFTRVGGTLGKVIRWAFEAQGLYGAGNGPGAPEPVDIYIRDGRPTRDHAMYGDTDYGPGSYVPVSLHWQAAGGGPAPAWQADPITGITFPNPNGDIEVRVGNRGSNPAANVKVSVFVAPWPAMNPPPQPPDWSAAGGPWTLCPPFGPAMQAIAAHAAPGAQPAFTFHLPAGMVAGAGRHLLFAQATCPADRPNTDPALLLACSTLINPLVTQVGLVDLIANDNNLGLLVVIL